MYCSINIACLLPLYIQVILEHEQGRALLADSLYHVNNPLYVAAKASRTEVLEVFTCNTCGICTARILSMQWNLLT